VFVVLIGVAAAAVTWLMGRDGSVIGGSPGVPTGTAVTVAAAHSFDPEGRDGRENESAAKNAIDGNPATLWKTERYNTANFSNLKKGVGLVLTLGSAAHLEQLEVHSATNSWSADVYVSSTTHPDLASWGEPVATRRDLAGNGTYIFDLRGTEGTAVLLWITDPGDKNQLEVSELVVRT
jgi:hypothetical protein